MAFINAVYHNEEVPTGFEEVAVAEAVQVAEAVTAANIAASLASTIQEYVTRGLPTRIACFVRHCPAR